MVGDRLIYIGFRRETLYKDPYQVDVCQQTNCEMFQVFDLATSKVIKEITIDFGQEIRNSYLNPQYLKMIFLRHDVLILNLPTLKVKQYVLIQFSDSGKAQ